MATREALDQWNAAVDRLVGPAPTEDPAPPRGRREARVFVGDGRRIEVWHRWRSGVEELLVVERTDGAITTELVIPVEVSADVMRGIGTAARRVQPCWSRR